MYDTKKGVELDVIFFIIITGILGANPQAPSSSRKGCSSSLSPGMREKEKDVGCRL
jgi:hypothetical protein